MPRIVDHEERRRELAAHAWALIREDGLQGVTIRALAERSGWSSGAVRHYLPTREAIMTFAAQQIVAWTRDYIQSLPFTGEPVDDFRMALLGTLPLTDDTRAVLEIWLAFAGEAVRGDAAAQQALLYDHLDEFLLSALGQLADAGYLQPDDAEPAARELHALLDGIAVHVLLGKVEPVAAEAAVDRWLERTLTRQG